MRSSDSCDWAFSFAVMLDLSISPRWPTAPACCCKTCSAKLAGMLALRSAPSRSRWVQQLKSSSWLKWCDLSASSTRPSKPVIDQFRPSAWLRALARSDADLDDRDELLRTAVFP